MADVLGERSKSRTGDGFDMPSESSDSVTLLKASAARIVPARALPLSNYAVFGEWLSLVEHLVRDQGVGGSNPLSPTIYLQADAVFSGIAKNPDVDDFVAVRASRICKRLLLAGQPPVIEEKVPRQSPLIAFFCSSTRFEPCTLIKRGTEHLFFELLKLHFCERLRVGKSETNQILA